MNKQHLKHQSLSFEDQLCCCLLEFLCRISFRLGIIVFLFIEQLNVPAVVLSSLSLSIISPLLHVCQVACCDKWPRVAA